MNIEQGISKSEGRCYRTKQASFLRNSTFLVRYSAVLLISVLSGCALITTPIKVIGTAATTTIKAGGAVVSGTAHAAGNIGTDDVDDKK